MKQKAYKDTNVSIQQSQGAIRTLLVKYGASGFQFSEDMPSRRIKLEFVHGDYMVRMTATTPEVGRHTPKGRFIRSEKTWATMRLKAERQVWRGLYWAVKSRMESIDFGIETFLEAFFAHIVVPQYQKTISQILIPQIEAGRLSLPEPEAR